MRRSGLTADDAQPVGQGVVVGRERQAERVPKTALGCANDLLDQLVVDGDEARALAREQLPGGDPADALDLKELMPSM